MKSQITTGQQSETADDQNNGAKETVRINVYHAIDRIVEEGRELNLYVLIGEVGSMVSDTASVRYIEADPDVREEARKDMAAKLMRIDPANKYLVVDGPVDAKQSPATSQVQHISNADLYRMNGRDVGGAWRRRR